MEKSSWLYDLKISWTKGKSSSGNAVCRSREEDGSKWHHYEIVEPRRLYVLWGSFHITDLKFPEENRNKQANTCYAVCAAMSTINTPEYWSSHVLDAIIVCGDRYVLLLAQSYKCLGTHIQSTQLKRKLIQELGLLLAQLPNSIRPTPAFGWFKDSLSIVYSTENDGSCNTCKILVESTQLFRVGSRK